jgi:hypothetical protein
MLVGPMCLALVSCLSANRSTLRSCSFFLFSAPGALLRLMLPLLTTLRFCPGSKHATTLLSCHRPS